MPLIRIRWQDAQRIADEPTGPVELQLIDDGNRNAKNRPYAYRCRTADWMAPQLGLGRRRIGAGLVGKGERNEIEQEPASLAYVASDRNTPGN